MTDFGNDLIAWAFIIIGWLCALYVIGIVAGWLVKHGIETTTDPTVCRDKGLSMARTASEGRK